MIIEFDWTKYWIRNDRFGPHAGFCLTNSRPGLEKYFYVVIPKNASSFVSDGIRQLGWTSNYYQEIYKPNRGQKVLVVLRDPYKRWVSGIVQYLSMYHTNNIPIITKDIFDLLIDKIVFDDHTEFQSYYLHGIDTNDCIFLNSDLNLRGMLHKTLVEKFFENNTPFININDINHSEYSSSHKNYKTQILNHLNNDSKSIEKIKLFYKKDYDLINSIHYEN